MASGHLATPVCAPVVAGKTPASADPKVKPSALEPVCTAAVAVTIGAHPIRVLTVVVAVVVWATMYQPSAGIVTGADRASFFAVLTAHASVRMSAVWARRLPSGS